MVADQTPKNCRPLLRIKKWRRRLTRRFVLVSNEITKTVAHFHNRKVAKLSPTKKWRRWLMCRLVMVAFEKPKPIAHFHSRKVAKLSPTQNNRLRLTRQMRGPTWATSSHAPFGCCRNPKRMGGEGYVHADGFAPG